MQEFKHIKESLPDDRLSPALELCCSKLPPCHEAAESKQDRK